MPAASTRVVVAILVVAGVSGCSLIGFAYNNAGWFAEREASRYVAMDEAQRERFRDLFDRTHERHRQQALGDYVLALNALDRRLATPGLSHDDAGCLARVGVQLYRDLAERLVPVAAELLANLRPAQIDELEAAFNEHNQEFAERYLLDSREARAERRAERAAERVAKWVGPLREQQLQLLSDLSRRLPDTAPGWSVYRQRQQRALLAALRQAAAPARVEALLRAWWVERVGMTADYEVAVQQLMQGMVAGAVRFETTLDFEQRMHFREKLQNVANGLKSVGEDDSEAGLLPVADGELVCAPESESLRP